VPALTAGFDPVVAEERPRILVRDGEPVDAEDATLLARRTG
jgi:hypothetical protein